MKFSESPPNNINNESAPINETIATLELSEKPGRRSAHRVNDITFTDSHTIDCYLPRKQSVALALKSGRAQSLSGTALLSGSGSDLQVVAASSMWNLPRHAKNDLKTAHAKDKLNSL
jgi:hypothetical protein